MKRPGRWKPPESPGFLACSPARSGFGAETSEIKECHFPGEPRLHEASQMTAQALDPLLNGSQLRAAPELELPPVQQPELLLQIEGLAQIAGEGQTLEWIRPQFQESFGEAGRQGLPLAAVAQQGAGRSCRQRQQDGGIRLAGSWFELP
jgi:hypothetical protein